MRKRSNLHPAIKASRGGWKRGMDSGDEWTFKGNPKGAKLPSRCDGAPSVIKGCRMLVRQRAGAVSVKPGGTAGLLDSLSQRTILGQVFYGRPAIGKEYEP